MEAADLTETNLQLINEEEFDNISITSKASSNTIL